MSPARIDFKKMIYIIIFKTSVNRFFFFLSFSGCFKRGVPYHWRELPQVSPLYHQVATIHRDSQKVESGKDSQGRGWGGRGREGGRGGEEEGGRENNPAGDQNNPFALIYKRAHNDTQSRTMKTTFESL